MAIAGVCCGFQPLRVVLLLGDADNCREMRISKWILGSMGQIHSNPKIQLLGNCMELYTIFIGCDDYPFHRLTLCILGSSTVPEFRSMARFALSYGQLLNRVLKMSFQRERPTPPEADLKTPAEWMAVKILLFLSCSLAAR